MVAIEDDDVHEEPEQFRLVLGSPASASFGRARVGKQNETLITINDNADSRS